ncbi:uncharacterized protein EI90DRAFT_3065002 [Cantharellus anzutake]|uniref:uncharacterized protein n=1 Tax=Cantharellus anzutake TaxID=1750568 RepID=UPI0019088914|nr:uncharacterized protein EI90DRAFT_3065002 [Cantharellus anzutake]KAF8328373.1 hypothetical protein EI90DRAFT_3065002 [Cantharellus anzutake]
MPRSCPNYIVIWLPVATAGTLCDLSSRGASEAQAPADSKSIDPYAHGASSLDFRFLMPNYCSFSLHNGKCTIETGSGPCFQTDGGRWAQCSALIQRVQMLIWIS